MNGRLILSALVVLAVLAGVTCAFAIQPDEMLKDPRLEARARTIDKELRCLVCQNESIDDSNADLAHDLRVLVRKRITAGDTNEEVKQYIVARYGDYVLLKPPFDTETYLLWFGPAILLLGGAVTAVIYYRHVSAQAAATETLSPEDERRLAVLLGKPDGEDA
jgi:cytochrome c-type biogenesis protein CcmH